MRIAILRTIPFDILGRRWNGNVNERYMQEVVKKKLKNSYVIGGPFGKMYERRFDGRNEGERGSEETKSGRGQVNMVKVVMKIREEVWRHFPL